MKNNDCCIIIPTHKSELTNAEKVSLGRIYKLYGQKYNIKLVCPPDINLDTYIEIGCKYGNIEETNYIILEKFYFSSICSYNIMLSIPGFYLFFKDYKYILIYQLDCYIFKNNLEDWINKGYSQVECITFCNEYYGNSIFNGEGLRKVKDCLYQTRTKREVFEDFYMKQLKNIELNDKYGIPYIFRYGEDSLWFSLLSDETILKECIRFGWSNNYRENYEKYGIPTMIHSFGRDKGIPDDFNWQKEIIGDWEIDPEGCINKEF